MILNTLTFATIFHHTNTLRTLSTSHLNVKPLLLIDTDKPI